jgi:TPR repeat protein
MGYKFANTVVLILASLVTQLACAGFDAGLAAYKFEHYTTALKELRPLAEQGDADAQFKLGFMYGTGQGVPKTISKR